MRVHALHVALCCTLLALAGCSGPAGVTPTPTEPAGVTPPTPAAELTVENPSRYPVAVLLYEDPDESGTLEAATTPVLNRSSEAPTIDVVGVEPGTDYRVVVRVNGTARWTDTIGYPETYRLAVAADGGVRVESIAVR